MAAFKIIMDRASIDAIMKGVGDAVQMEGKLLVKRLCETAVRFLSSLENKLDRKEIAKRWTHTEPLERSNGDVVAEVWNRLENEVWYNTDATGEHRSHEYPIHGKSLLRILLWGASPHDIEPRGQDYPLSFMSPMGDHKSIFHGTIDHPTRGIGAFLYKSDQEDDFISTERVNHPGVTGDDFLMHTQNHIERVLAEEIENTVNKISTRIK